MAPRVCRNRLSSIFVLAFVSETRKPFIAHQVSAVVRKREKFSNYFSFVQFIYLLAYQNCLNISIVSIRIEIDRLIELNVTKGWCKIMKWKSDTRNTESSWKKEQVGEKVFRLAYQNTAFLLEFNSIRTEVLAIIHSSGGINWNTSHKKK